MFKSLFLEEKNFNRTSLEIALDMIYVFNGCRLIKDKIELGEPKALDQRPEVPDDPNTFLPIIVDENIDYRFDAIGNNNGLMYRRLEFSEIKDIDKLEVSITQFPFKTSDVLDQINITLNTKLTLDDVVNIEYHSQEEGFRLVANPKSLAWVGSIELRDVVARVKNNLFSVLLLDDFKVFNDIHSEPTKPYIGNSIQRLVDRLNEANGTDYEYYTDFTFGGLTQVSGESGYNTEVTIIPTDTFNYNIQKLRYTRLSLNVLNILPFEWINFVRITKLPFTIHEMLTEINDHLGLSLTASEVTNTEYNTEQNEYTLRISDVNSSLAWTKSSYIFKAYIAGSGERYTEDGILRITEDNIIRYIE